MRSNAADRSASRTHWRLDRRPLSVQKIASIASWQPRPGRNPYERGSNRASHSGSSALATRACYTRSRSTGIPSGRCFPPAFGMYTRLTGRACHGAVRRWISTANEALAGEVNATCPSMPAVLRPALRCVTRRTLTSVFDRLRSISFCRLRTRFRSPSCDALKIRRRSRRTSSSTGRHKIASQSKSSSRGPFTSPVSNLSASTSDANVSPLHRLTRPTSATLTGPGTTPGIRPVIRRSSLKERRYRPRFPAAFRPPALAFWAILFPPRRSAFLTVSPPGTTARNPNGVTTFRMRETRPGRVPPKPRGGGVHATGQMPPVAACRFTTASPTPRSCFHLPGAHFDEASTAVHSRSPVRPSPRL